MRRVTPFRHVFGLRGAVAHSYCVSLTVSRTVSSAASLAVSLTESPTGGRTAGPPSPALCLPPPPSPSLSLYPPLVAAQLGPLRDSANAEVIGCLAAAGLVGILAVCLAMYGAVSFQTETPLGNKTLSGRATAADPLQTADGCVSTPPSPPMLLI
jgi:hypothetical protein